MTNHRYDDRTRPLKPFDDLIKQIIGDQQWKEHAACKGMDVSTFFPERGFVPFKAITICNTCPVQEQCKDFAIANDEQHGIWGGLALRARRKESKQRHKNHGAERSTSDERTAQ